MATGMPLRDKTRILFFAEAVTLAHVARPLVLAASLDSRDFDVHFAHHPRYRALIGELPFTEHEIESIEPQQFMSALARGGPLYSVNTLRDYVSADLALIEKLKPDIVVGDFRLSLAVSTRVAKVPYVTLSNAYWCPYSQQKYIVPELPMVNLLGPKIAQVLFNLARPFAFFHHTRPLNRVLREYGLPGLGWNIRRIYTWADYTLYADIPELFRTVNLPANHHFIGPIVWSPPDPLPPWWQEMPVEKPIVYVTLGSSGNATLLPEILAVLAELEVTAVVSTAGGEPPRNPYRNVFMAEFLPGHAVASRASLVICNGGSPTTHQALACGKPVLGIPHNMDQYLNMQAVASAGAGIWMRSDCLDAKDLGVAVTELLNNESYSTAATDIAGMFASRISENIFYRIIKEISIKS